MGRRLYVGNLNYATTDSDLRLAFEAGGRSVTDVHIVTDRETGRPRGFAFVELATDEEAQAAIQDMHGADLDGRNLTVNEARDRPARGGGGGGGGGRW